VLLKDKMVITTERLYEQLEACEKATEKRRYAKGHIKRKNGLQVALNHANNMQRKEEV